MSAQRAFATKLPVELTEALGRFCRRHGLRRNFVVEQALRDKLEDLADMFDLEEARHTATAFVGWEDVTKELQRRRKL